MSSYYAIVFVIRKAKTHGKTREDTKQSLINITEGKLF